MDNITLLLDYFLLLIKIFVCIVVNKNLFPSLHHTKISFKPLNFDQILVKNFKWIPCFSSIYYIIFFWDLFCVEIIFIVNMVFPFSVSNLFPRNRFKIFIYNYKILKHDKENDTYCLFNGFMIINCWARILLIDEFKFWTQMINLFLCVCYRFIYLD